MKQTDSTFRSGDVEIAGTFVRPDVDTPRPAALILHGSGPLDRDGNIKRFPLGVSKDLAALLTENGVASYRYDKRGIGQSGGDYLSTGFYEEIEDAEAAYQWLAAREEVSDVFVIGHSVGATIASELGARHGELLGVICLAMTAKTGRETLAWQTQQMKDHIIPRPVKAVLRVFGTDVVKQQRKAMAKLEASESDVMRVQMQKMNAKWMREFIAYDPTGTLGRVAVPMLAITGSKDVQVDPSDLDLIEDLVGVVETHALEDVDHILRHETAEISNPRFYRKQFAKPIDPRVIDVIANWISQRMVGGDGLD